MSGRFLVQINQDFDLDIPSDLLRILKNLDLTEDNVLSSFPGWSIHRFELVEKWEGYRCYSFMLRYTVHEDIFDGEWDEFLVPFLKKLAKYAKHKGGGPGFIGTIESSESSYPSLIYLIDGSPVIWDVENKEPGLNPDSQLFLTRIL